MDNTTLETEWARSQIEAMADGSLGAAERARMVKALDRDPGLRAALDEAKAVLRGLEAFSLPKPPAGLRGRLLAAAPARRRRFAPVDFAWSGMAVTSAGVLATAVIAFSFGSLAMRTPDIAEQAAMRDFGIAMAYLRQTAAMTRDEVNQQLGQGLVTAIEISTHTLTTEDGGNESNGG